MALSGLIRGSLVLGMAVVVGMAGCGGPRATPVASEEIPLPDGIQLQGNFLVGKVTLDGKLVKTGIVFLQSESGKEYSAEISPEGAFWCDNMTEGTYNVWFENGAAMQNRETKEIHATWFPERYRQPGGSGLIVEVVAGENRVHFELH
jgi:hypothetical protein